MRVIELKKLLSAPPTQTLILIIDRKGLRHQSHVHVHVNIAQSYMCTCTCTMYVYVHVRLNIV